jgi:LacI family transcriptional regulator
VDGLIVAGKVSLPFIAKASRFGIPIVLVDFELKRKRYPAVLIENRSGANAAVTHLVSRGHSKIAFVGGDIDHPSLAERLEGFRDALADQGLPPQPHFIDTRESDSRIANGASAMGRLLEQQPRPTAVFAANDAMAIGCMQEIARAGLDVPKDIAVAGFDDIEVSALMYPSLTTLRVFKEELGRQAVETLVGIIKSENSTLVTKHVPVELIIRESTAGMVSAERKRVVQDQVG